MKDILIATLSIVIIIWRIYKSKETMKACSKLQILGISISYMFATIIAAMFIYYGGSWIADKISIKILGYTVQLILIFIVLFSCVSILNKVLHKISNGLLPNNK